MTKTKLRSFAVALLSCVMVFALCLGLGLAPKQAKAEAGKQPEEEPYLSVDFQKWYETNGSTTISGKPKIVTFTGTEINVFNNTKEGDKNYLTFDGVTQNIQYNQTSSSFINATVYGLTQSSSQNADITLTFNNITAKSKVRLLAGIDTSDLSPTYKPTLTTGGGDAVELEYTNGVKDSGVPCLIAGNTYSMGAKAKYFEFEIEAGTSIFTVNPTKFGDKSGKSTTRKFYIYAIELYATAKSYTVTFDMNGATSEQIAAVKVVEGETVKEPTAPTKTGSVFHGWHVKDDAGNKEHYDFDAPVKSDLNLIAIWNNENDTEITSFDNFTNTEDLDPTERTWTTKPTVEYTGQTREQVRAAAIALLPTEATAHYGDGQLSIPLKWEHRYEADLEQDDEAHILGEQVYVAYFDTMPEGYYTKLWLRAIVTVIDGRETITNVNDKVEITVAEGANLNEALPKEVKVTTDKNSEIAVKVTWEWNPEDVVAGKSLTVKGTPENKYSLSEGVEISATVTVVGSTHKVEVKQEKVAHWDSRNNEKTLEDYNKDADGNFIILNENGVKVTVQNTASSAAGATSMGGTTGHAFEIYPTDEKNSKPQSWVKIEVSLSSKINVRAASNGSSTRDFIISDSEKDNSSGVKYAKKSVKSSAADAYKNDETAVISAEVKAGTYYFWVLGTNGAQVYEIYVDEIAITDNFTFENNQKLFTAAEMPAKEDYAFVGWVYNGTLIDDETATESGEYAPLYAKITVTGSVKLGEEVPAIRFGFTIELINGDALADLESITVKFEVSAKNTVQRDGIIAIEDGTIKSNLVINGWTEENVKLWRETVITVKITVDLGGKTIGFSEDGGKTEGVKRSAKEIAQEALDNDESGSLEGLLNMYLGE